MRPTVGRRIGLSSAVFVLIVLAVSVIAFGQVRALTKTLRLTQKESETTTLVTGLQSWTLELARAQAHYISSESDSHETKWREAFSELRRNVEEVRGRLVLEKQDERLEDFVLAQARYEETFNEIKKLLREFKTAGIAGARRLRIERAYDQSLVKSSLLANLMIDLGSEIVALNKEEIDRRIEDVSAMVEKVRWVSLAVIFVGLLIALGMGILTSRSISRPIEKLTRGARTIAGGDLDIKLDIRSKDEVGDLARTFNQMAENLKKTTVSRDELQKEVVIRKRAEAELKKANAKLKKLSDLKTEFVNIVAHELRTPVFLIQESVQSVLEGLLGKVSPDQKDYLTISVNTTKRMGRIINDLLDVSKIEAGKFEIKRERINLIEVIGKVMAAFSARMKKKGLVFRERYPREVVEVEADPDKIGQILTNLVGNAVKFTERGSIEIGLCERDGVVELSLADTGPGISKEDLPKLFEKFRQFGQHRNGEKGTGLGLSITKSLVELHKGRIWVESELGKGTRFIVTLPRMKVSRPDKDEVQC